MTTNDTADVTDADDTDAEKVTDEAVDEATRERRRATETNAAEPRHRAAVARGVRARLGAILLAAALVARQALRVAVLRAVPP